MAKTSNCKYQWNERPENGAIPGEMVVVTIAAWNGFAGENGQRTVSDPSLRARQREKEDADVLEY